MCDRSIYQGIAASSARIRLAARGTHEAQSCMGRPGRSTAVEGCLDERGKYREIPIVSAEQRQALDNAKALAGTGSLIPQGMRYKDQLERFKSQCAKAGIAHVHGQRHRYAQLRYEELAGWKCPACGGPSAKQLTLSQKARDRAVRLLVSRELGHEREQITSVYLGR